MPGIRRVALLFAAEILSGVLRAQVEVKAQSQPAAPETSMTAVLQHLTARAGAIFVGQVVRIDRVERLAVPGEQRDAEPGIVTVTFAVVQPVVGSMGPTYTLREWGGLWVPGLTRYWVGERALLFLTPPSRAGLASPVDGMEGVVPMVVITADAAPLLDVRRLNARLKRQLGEPLSEAEAGAMELPAVTALVRRIAMTPTIELAAKGGVDPSLAAPPRLPLPASVAPKPSEPITLEVSTVAMRAAAAQSREAQRSGHVR